MGDTEKVIAGDLRIIARNSVLADQTLIAKIAHGLNIPNASVIKMFEAARWDLPLAMKVIDIIRVAVFVVTVQDRTKPVSRARTRSVTMTLDSLTKAAERTSKPRTPMSDAKAAPEEHTEMQKAVLAMQSDAHEAAERLLPKSVKDGLK